MFSNFYVCVLDARELKVGLRGKGKGFRTVDIDLRKYSHDDLTGVSLIFDKESWKIFKTQMREVLDDDDGTAEVVGAGRTEESAGGPAQEGEDAA